MRDIFTFPWMFSFLQQPNLTLSVYRSPMINRWQSEDRRKISPWIKLAWSSVHSHIGQHCAERAGCRHTREGCCIFREEHLRLKVTISPNHRDLLELFSDVSPPKLMKIEVSHCLGSWSRSKFHSTLTGYANTHRKLKYIVVLSYRTIG